MSGELLEIAIPRGLAKQVAEDMHVAPRQVQRWRQGEEPTPVDRFQRFIRALYLSHPSGAEMVIEAVNQDFRELQGIHAADNLADLNRECNEAVQAGMDKKTLVQQISECLEAQAELSKRLAWLETQNRKAALPIRKTG